MTRVSPFEEEKNESHPYTTSEGPRGSSLAPRVIPRVRSSDNVIVSGVGVHGPESHTDGVWDVCPLTQLRSVVIGHNKISIGVDYLLGDSESNRFTAGVVRCWFLSDSSIRLRLNGRLQRSSVWTLDIVPSPGRTHIFPTCFRFHVKGHHLEPEGDDRGPGRVKLIGSHVLRTPYM